MTEPSLIVAADGLVLSLRLHRPAARNALSTELLHELADHLDVAAEDADVRAVVLSGGQDYFAAGADVRELRDTSPTQYLTSKRRRAWERVATFPKPVVAGVAGYALGGGCELALMTDAIVAGESAVFGQPEVGLGIVPGAGGVQWWARTAGRFRAMELLLTGRALSADQAHRFGVVTKVVPDESVSAAAAALAHDFAAQAPVAAQLLKWSMRQTFEAPAASGIAFERAMLAVTLSTDDHREGMDAFLERRRANFEGK